MLFFISHAPTCSSLLLLPSRWIFVEALMVPQPGDRYYDPYVLLLRSQRCDTRSRPHDAGDTNEGSGAVALLIDYRCRYSAPCRDEFQF